MTQDENIFEETSAAEPTPFLSLDLSTKTFSMNTKYSNRVKETFEAAQAEIRTLKVERDQVFKATQLTIGDLQDRVKNLEGSFLNFNDSKAQSRFTAIEETIESLKESLEGAHQNREAIVKSDLPYIRERLASLEAKVASERFSQSVTMPPENWEARLTQLEQRLDGKLAANYVSLKDTLEHLTESHKEIEKRLQYIESALLKGGIIPGKIGPTPKLENGNITMPFEVFLSIVSKSERT